MTNNMKKMRTKHAGRVTESRSHGGTKSQAGRKCAGVKEREKCRANSDAEFNRCRWKQSNFHVTTRYRTCTQFREKALSWYRISRASKQQVGKCVTRVAVNTDWTFRVVDAKNMKH